MIKRYTIIISISYLGATFTLALELEAQENEDQRQSGWALAASAAESSDLRGTWSGGLRGWARRQSRLRLSSFLRLDLEPEAFSSRDA